MERLQFSPETHTYTLDGVEVPSVTEICAPLTAGKYPPSGVVDAAAARGTAVHELCALYDMDALPDEIDPGLMPYLTAWERFTRDYRPVWEYIEQSVTGSCRGGAYAGTIDRLGVIDNRCLVVDIKTAQSLDRQAKVSLCCQLAGYQITMTVKYPIEPVGLGVQLMKDGTYRVHEQRKIEERYGFNSWEIFENLRAMHRIMKGK